jgi:hypothetical protein
LFPALGVLDAMSDLCRSDLSELFSHAVFVCVQHILETTGSLLEAMIGLGAKPASVHIVGKCYSTNPDVLDELSQLGISCHGGSLPTSLGTYRSAAENDVGELWQRVLRATECLSLKRLVVLDDGGRCISAVPSEILKRVPVIGIEQTTSGLRHPNPARFPVIEVASCAAKKVIEPHMIARALFSKVVTMLGGTPLPSACGVVGFGSIGRAVAVALVRKGHTVHVCDPMYVRHTIPGDMVYAATFRDVLSQCDCIFGCSGNDITYDPEALFGGGTGHKILISCSSEDQEFRSLLQHIAKTLNGPAPDPLSSFTFGFPGSDLNLTLLRGGFPSNFDGARESVNAGDIELTRGLLLGAVIQALARIDGTNDGLSSRLMLDPIIQQYVVEQWLRGRTYRLQDCPDVRWFRSTVEVRNQSSGSYKKCRLLEDIFGNVRL